MDISWRIALGVVAAAFVVFLIAKMWPRGLGGTAGSPSIEGARKRAREAKSPRERATALCEAAVAAHALPFGSTRAAAYYLRAMRADPTWPGSVERASIALARRRSRTLEKMLWRRLGGTPWDTEHADVLRAIVTALATVAAGARGRVGQTKLLERVLAGEALSLPRPKA